MKTSITVFIILLLACLFGCKKPQNLSQPLYNESAKQKQVWLNMIPSNVSSSPAYHDGMLYVTCYNGGLYAIEIEEGYTKWTFHTEGYSVSSPVVNDDGIFFGSSDGSFYAITPSGKLKWKIKTGMPVSASPQLDDDRVYFGGYSKKFYAVDFKTGKIRYTFPCESGIKSKPVIIGSRVIFTDVIGTIYCLNKQTGVLLWKKSFGTKISSDLVVYNNSIFMNSEDQGIYQLSPETGHVRWQYRDPQSSIGNFNVAEGLLIVGAKNFFIKAVDLRTKQEKWQFKTNEIPYGQPLITSSGQIFVGCDDHWLYCLNFEGEPVWKFEATARIASLPVIAAGKLFFVSQHGFTYGLRL